MTGRTTALLALGEKLRLSPKVLSPAPEKLLPGDTGLQRAGKDHLAAGGRIGIAWSVLR